MIFDDIARNIEFKVTDRKGEWDYVVSLNEFHLALMLQKNKISFMDLMRGYYEDDEKTNLVTMAFKDDEYKITHVTVCFYENDDDLLAEVHLEADCGFNEYLTRMCGI